MALTTFDSIDGGAGTDALNITVVGNIDTTGALQTNIANIESATLLASGTLTTNTSAWTGLTSLSTNSVGGALVTAAATTDVTVTAQGVTAAVGVVTVSGGNNVTVAATGTTTVAADALAEIAVSGAAGAVTVTNSFTGADAGIQADVAVTGGTTITVTESLGNAVNTTNTQGKVVVTGSASTTTVSVTQDAAATAAAAVVGKVNGTVTITDVNAGTSTADKITTVTLNSYGDSTIDSAALTNLNLSGTGGTLGINRTTSDTTANATTLNMTVAGGAALGAISGTHAADFTTVNVVTTGTSASTIADFTGTAATALNVSGTSKVTFTDFTMTALTAVTAGDGGLALGTSPLATGASFTGGAGVDSVIVGATTKAIAMGAGNDTVTLASGTTAIGTNGTVSGGDGTDTLAMVAADAATADDNATFAGKVTGFEKLQIVTPTTNTIDVATLGSYNYVKTAGATALTLSGLTTGATLELTATGTAYNVSFSGAAVAATDDVLNIVTSNGTGTAIDFATAGVTVANTETVNITTADTQTTQSNVMDLIEILDAGNKIKTMNVSGTDGMNLTFVGTGATNIDASGITAGGFTWTAGALTAANVVKGSATGTNDVTLTAATAATTYTGGTGNDVITNTNNLNNTYTLGNGANSINTGGAAGNGNNTVTGGTGVDIIKLGNGNNTITTGAGNDVIIVGTGANVISAGDGNDSITVGASAGLNTIDVGAGTDTVVLGGVQAAAGYYTSVTGMAAGDKIDLSGVTATARADSALGAKITLGGAATFANYLDAATAGVVADNGAATMAWFQLNGNTYIVVDTETGFGVDGTTFQDGVDSVIELVGLVTLTTSATVSDVLTLV